MGDPPKKLTRVSFCTYTDHEIINLSVKEVTNTKAFDALGHPNAGGLYDRVFGPSERNDVCSTCGMNDQFCPGHMGHISLPMPVYHPLWIRNLYMILRGTCFSCKHLLETSVVTEHLLCMLKLLDHNLWDDLDGLQLIYCTLENEGAGKVSQKMREFVDKKIEGKNQRDTVKSEDRPQTIRYMEATRSSLLQEYMSTVFAARKGNCPHCFVPIRKLRLEHNSKLYFDEGASKRGIEKAKKALTEHHKKKNKTKKNKKIDKTTEDEQDEGEAELSGEEESITTKTPAALPDLSEFEQKIAGVTSRALLMPSDVRQHMRDVWDNCSDVLKHICGMLRVPLHEQATLVVMPTIPQVLDARRPTDAFFLSVIPVTPNRFRPLMMQNGIKFENPRNTTYTSILENCEAMTTAIRDTKNKQVNPEDNLDQVNANRNQAFEQLYRTMLTLQVAVNTLLDADLDKLASKSVPGVRQILEKKEGLFRKHMMGKRVDYAARSVISPDPFISVDEIGIPEVFATKLTFPEPVTPHNIQRLRQAVINGPRKHPGATHVVSETGQKTLLTEKLEQREAIAKSLLTETTQSYLNAKPKIVMRHIKNGDMLLLNRQPTLHKPSIQAHKAHILPGEKTIRLHYANCKAYNADFDGDEMNAHFPQHFIGQAEARLIATTQQQYLVPKDGTPLAGLIQDHMIAGVTLCVRGRYFSREDYHQLVFSGLTDQQRRVKLLPPTIIKPQRLWSGKQVISTLLFNLFPGERDTFLTLNGTSKIPGKSWVNGNQTLNVPGMGEETVIIRHGELLCGVLDKNHYGATPHGLVHACYELYGGAVASQLLTSLARLFTTFLTYRGFTIGVEDILCKPKADAVRIKAMNKGATLGAAAAAQAFNIEDPEDKATMDSLYSAAHFDSDQRRMQELDMCMKKVSDGIQNEISQAIMPNGLLKQFPYNNLQLMVVSGAKGSSVNCMQISCLLGQIELEGRRPPITLSGRSLPSFKPYDTTPRAGGFVDGRFLSGIRPQEYFFHCMAGREGLVDTAVKTSRSGYLQRCLIKHLEGIVVEYDSTVRDSDGSVIQFQYGEDGFDVTKTNLLNRKQFAFLIDNRESAADKEELRRLRMLDRKGPKKWERKLRKYREMCSSMIAEGVERLSPFLHYTRGRGESQRSATDSWDEKLCRTKVAKTLEAEFRSLDEETAAELRPYSLKCPDPTVSVYMPTKYFGSLPERLRCDLEDYIRTNPDKLLTSSGAAAASGQLSKKEFEDLLSLCCCRSRAAPGDGVGILAAQSIGEPSTQMTLNTFHFAGRGEMNVTLGIPRLREILMVASKKMKTPSMDIPFKETRHAQRRARNLQLKLNTVRLSEVIEKVHVYTHLITKGPTSDWGRVYKIHMDFLPPDQYNDRCLLTPLYILRHVERFFIASITKGYAKVMKLNADIKLLNSMEADGETTTAPSAGEDGEDFPEARAPPTSETLDEDEDADGDVDQDADASMKKQQQRHGEERDYEGEDEELMEILGEDDEDERLELLGGDGGEGSNDEHSEGEGETLMSDSEDDKRDEEGFVIDRSGLDRKSKKQGVRVAGMGALDPKRIQEVLKYPGVISYAYDVEHELWCEVTYKYPLSNVDIDMTPIVQKEARNSVVCDPAKVVQGVTKAIITQPKSPGQPMRLRTEGVNIQKILAYEDLLDLNNLYTNDIHAMAASYGIEAACKVLIKEVRDVFAAYGITVNYRHLSLIADYMTFDGEYKAFNRTGLSGNASAFQKMSYEACTTFLKAATYNGAVDDLNSPSARIIVGRPVKVGTGSFDLQLQAFRKAEE